MTDFAQIDGRELDPNNMDEVLRLMFEESPMGKAVINIQGGNVRIALSNPSLEQMTGYTSEELKDVDLLSLVHPDDLAETQMALTGIIDGTEPVADSERRYIRKNGEVFWGRVHSYGIGAHPRTGNPELICVHIQDVTQEKRGKELNQAIAETVAGAAHDIKGKIGMTGNYIQYAIDMIRGGGDINKALGLLESAEAVNDMNKERVKELSKLGDLLEGRVSLEIVNYTVPDLNSMIHDLVDVYVPETRQKGIDINLEFDSPEEDLAIPCDILRIRNILDNLIANAAKYTREGGRILVKTEVDPECGFMMIVGDNGIGIPQEDVQKIWEVGQRGSNVGDVEGTGIGLPLCKFLVDLHKGHMDAQSSIGVGTTFTVCLPLEMAA